jgi:hypothetical protein
MLAVGTKTASAQQTQTPAVPLEHRGRLGAGAELRAVDAAEEVGLAVVGDALAVGADELHGVVRLAVGVVLGVAMDDGNAVALRNGGHRLRQRAVGWLGERGHGSRADLVTGERHLGTHQHLGTLRAGLCGGGVEP